MASNFFKYWRLLPLTNYRKMYKVVWSISHTQWTKIKILLFPTEKHTTTHTHTYKHIHTHIHTHAHSLADNSHFLLPPPTTHKALYDSVIKLVQKQFNNVPTIRKPWQICCDQLIVLKEMQTLYLLHILKEEAMNQNWNLRPGVNPLKVFKR